MPDLLTHKKIVLFNGPPGCGKDTAVRAVMDSVKFKGVMPSMHNKFAEPLKRAVHELFALGISWDYYDDPKYAHLKNEPLAALDGMSAREAYIWMSEEVMKPKFGEDIFGCIAIRAIEKARHTVLHLFSDSGFLHEAMTLVDYFSPAKVMVVEIHAADKNGPITFKGDSRGYIGADLLLAKKDVTVKKLYNTISDNREELQMFKHLALSCVANFVGLELA